MKHFIHISTGGSRRVSMLLTFALLLLCHISCASSKAVANDTDMNRTIAIERSFKGIEASALFTIEYTVNSSAPVAVISGPAKLVQQVDYQINSDGMLKFVVDGDVKGSYRSGIKIRLNGRQLNNYVAARGGSLILLSDVALGDVANISCSSGADIIFRSSFKTRNTVNIASASGSDIIFQSLLKGTTINLAASGGSDIKLSGIEADVVNMAGSSGSDIRIEKVKGSTVNVAASGGSDAIIDFSCICTTLNLSLASGSDAMINGIEATTVNCKVGGASDATLKGTTQYANFVSRSASEINHRALRVINP